MIRIHLTQDRDTIIDDEDYNKVKNIKFYAVKAPHTWYAKYSVSKYKKFLLHRLILSAKPNEIIDHINGNGLDNRRCNLRIVTSSQNSQNRVKRGVKSSKFKGVTWHAHTGKWQAILKIKDKNHYLGVFEREIDAAKVYNIEAVKVFGNFARLNNVMEDSI